MLRSSDQAQEAKILGLGIKDSPEDMFVTQKMISVLIVLGSQVCCEFFEPVTPHGMIRRMNSSKSFAIFWPKYVLARLRMISHYLHIVLIYPLLP